ncbi:flagellar assembly peptidoglycan hydrolase FlgJ [Rheinheimera sp.]|uniref:flagellar assembly peptidoglycan hydrolase FlgJ n=1 Tax=Rheinheimera sp. TaxID=1869214 RepID=UPI00307CF971
MKRLEQQVNYHDLGSLQQLKAKSAQDDDAALQQAAKQFESIFMSMLLSSMRKANEAFEADGLMNSQTTEFYRDMYDKQLASELSENGSLGLADLIVQQLKPPASKKRIGDDAHTQLNMPQGHGARVQSSNDVQSLAAKPSSSLPEAVPYTAEPQVIASGPAESDSNDWSFTEPADFVRKLLPAAEQAAAKLGLEPLALLAQAALETGWGQRMFKTGEGENSFNFFGIKASHGWQGDVAVVDTLEYRQGVAAKEKARFRAYSSPEQSLNDYADFIQNNPRYQQALEVSSNPKAYFQQLQAAGYATDPNYAQKIWAVFNSDTFKQARNLLAITKS